MSKKKSEYEKCEKLLIQNFWTKITVPGQAIGITAGTGTRDIWLPPNFKFLDMIPSAEWDLLESRGDLVISGSGLADLNKIVLQHKT